MTWHPIFPATFHFAFILLKQFYILNIEKVEREDTEGDASTFKGVRKKILALRARLNSAPL